MNGKAGTITPEEFTALSDGAGTYGVRVLAQKVAKICSKKSDALKHEFLGSTIAAAYAGVATKILGAVGSTGSKAVSTDFFNSLTQMVATYGPEVVIWKLSKIAKKANNGTDSALLSGLFPNGSKKLGSSTDTAAVKKPAARRSAFV